MEDQRQFNSLASLFAFIAKCTISYRNIDLCFTSGRERFDAEDKTKYREYYFSNHVY